MLGFEFALDKLNFILHLKPNAIFCCSLQNIINEKVNVKRFHVDVIQCRIQFTPMCCCYMYVGKLCDIFTQHLHSKAQTAIKMGRGRKGRVTCLKRCYAWVNVFNACPWNDCSSFFTLWYLHSHGKLPSECIRGISIILSFQPDGNIQFLI